MSTQWRTSWGNSPAPSAGAAPSGGAPSKPRPRGNRRLLVLGGVLGLIGAALVCWLLSSSKEEPTPANPKARPSKVAKPVVRPPAARPTTKPAQPAEKPEAKAKPKEEFVKAPGKMQLPDGRVLTFPPPKEGETRIIHSHGLTFKCDHLGNWEDITPKPVFDNAFEENLIGVAGGDGNFIPGMLMGMDQKEVIAMLNKQVVIKPDDPPEVAQKKEDVALLKQGILEYIKQGGTFDDFVMEMRHITAQQRKVKSTAMRDIVQLLKENKVEEAAFYRKSINEKLTKDGAKPIRFPAHISEILDQVQVPDQPKGTDPAPATDQPKAEK